PAIHLNGKKTRPTTTPAIAATPVWAAHSTTSSSPTPAASKVSTSAALVRGADLVRDLPAVAERVPVLARPRTDRRTVTASGARRALAADAAAGGDEGLERCDELVAVGVGQVDLVLGVLPGEAVGPRPLGAVDVVGDDDVSALSHGGH